jgi:hypothetical protein
MEQSIVGGSGMIPPGCVVEVLKIRNAIGDGEESHKYIPAFWNT